MRVWLVGCSKSKRAHPCAAAKMYEPSALFRMCVKYALGKMRDDDRWMICSAKLGLLDPTQVIEPYEHRLGRAEAPAWGATIAARLAALNVSAFTSLLGADYDRPIFLHMPSAIVDRPLAGMSMGHRLAFLKQQTKWDQ